MYPQAQIQPGDKQTQMRRGFHKLLARFSGYFSFRRVTFVLRGGFASLVVFSLIFSTTFPLGVQTASAANTVPKLLNYQARITDSSGVPVADGNLNIWISVYDAP